MFRPTRLSVSAAALAAVIIAGAALVQGARTEAVAIHPAPLVRPKGLNVPPQVAAPAAAPIAVDPVVSAIEAGAAAVAATDAGSEARLTAVAVLLARALDEAEAGNWTDAAALAAETRDPVAAEIIRWTRLRDGAGRWREYERFVLRHADWPGLQVLRRSGERLLPEGIGLTRVKAFLAGEPPQSGTGALRLAAALERARRPAEAEAVIVEAWRTLSMSSLERSAMLADWDAVVEPHHEARLDMLLWEGWTQEAEAMLPYVSPDWQALAQARILTRRDAEGLQYAINKVPARLKADPGLAFERYRYRVEKGRWDEAEAFIAEASTSAAALGRPEMWMERRANLARQALARGEIATAYRIASNNFGATGADFADTEWVAGFVALVHRNDPAAAAAHFERFGEVVATPISLGRAGYWLGLARARMDDAAGAAEAFAAAAAHQTSFYGQLAAERAGIAADPLLAEAAAPDWRSHPPLQASSVVRASRLLIAAGDEVRAAQFLRHAADSALAADRAALAQMASDLGLPHIGLRVAKDAAADGVIIPAQYYPLHDIAGRDWPVPTEFALAIARQESEFNPGAVSTAGARGLMQLMPATAKEVASVASLAYDLERLGRDPIYNATLGTAYLSRMLRKFDGSYLLAAAAYNAGPGRVDDWIDANGDPRLPGVDAVVWVETIPFTETRNYVMRVLEALHVYRARLSGAPAPLRLSADINAAG